MKKHNMTIILPSPYGVYPYANENTKLSVQIILPSPYGVYH